MTTLVGKVQRRLSMALPRHEAPRHATPVATHVPVLIGIACSIRVQRVLELGSGLYSTATFLDRSAFPDLEHLVTLENDATWAAQTTEMIAGDPRSDFRLIGSIADAVQGLDLSSYDVVLVDDSSTLTEREATIRQIATAPGAARLTLVHDYEIYEYRQASKAFPHRFVFDPMTPQTGVCWRGNGIDVRSLKGIRRTIAASATAIDPSDRAAWIQAFEREG